MQVLLGHMYRRHRADGNSHLAFTSSFPRWAEGGFLYQRFADLSSVEISGPALQRSSALHSSPAWLLGYGGLEAQLVCHLMSFLDMPSLLQRPERVGDQTGQRTRIARYAS